MNMQKFTLTRSGVTIYLSDGRVLLLHFNTDSGKVFYRYKIGTLSDVKHPGIFIGFDRAGRKYFMHNHYHTSKPSIVSEKEFTQGLPIALYKGEAVNSRLKTLELGLAQILQGEPYNWHTYNCQSFVNRARNNQSKSDDVEKWTNGLLAGLLLIIGIKALNS